jgi:hypothetical protein
MGTFLKQRPSNVDFSKVISSMYEKGGNFKGD